MGKRLPCFRCGARVKLKRRDCPKCGKVLLRVIADRFEVHECLNYADTQFALRAWDRLDKQEVFVRATLPTASPLVTNAISMEANVLLLLAGCPNIPAFIYGGKLAETGGLYSAQEFLTGSSLGKALESLSPIERVDLIRHAAAAVAPLHEQGLVHCKLSLDSFILTPKGRVVLLDFRETRSAGEPSGGTGEQGYIAPEQRSAFHPITAAIDVFALGALAYRALTGKGPYPRKVEKSLGARWPLPRKPSEVSSKIADDFDVSILRALAYEPSTRFATAREFHEALARDAGGDTVVDALPYTFPSSIQLLNQSVVSGAILFARLAYSRSVACMAAISWYSRVVGSLTGVPTAAVLASTAGVIALAPFVWGAASRARSALAEREVAAAVPPLASTVVHNSKSSAAANIVSTLPMPSPSELAASANATVQFLTWPPANVYLDDELLVEAPSPESFTVSAGHHRIRLVPKRGAQRWIVWNFKQGNRYTLMFNFDSDELDLQEVDPCLELPR